MPAPTFLTIYPELRDLIYTIYLTSPDPLPPSSVTRANRFSHRNQFPSYGWPWNMDARFHMDHCINYRDPTIYPVVPASLPLLLCNRQINAEVSSTIAFLTTHTKQLWYEIDCEIVNEVELYPTWLHVPINFKEATIPVVYATCRTVGQLQPEQRSGWRHGCGGPGWMVWGLMELLNRFLERGPNLIASKVGAPAPPIPDDPSPPSTSGSTSKVTHVADKLKLLKNRLFKGSRSSANASPTASIPESSSSSSQAGSPLNPTPNKIKIDKLVIDFGPETLANGGDYRNPSDGTVPTVKVVKHVEQYLDFLFSGSKSTISYARFIALRVGSVHLLCDGEEVVKWDLDHLTKMKAVS